MLLSHLLAGSLLAAAPAAVPLPAALPQSSGRQERSSIPQIDVVNGHLDRVGWSVVAAVQSLTREVSHHAQRTAADPRVGQMLREEDSRAAFEFASRIVSSSKLVEEICIYDRRGDLFAFQDDEDHGEVFDGPRLRAMVAKSKGNPHVIRSVVSGPIGSDSLQFERGNVGSEHNDSTSITFTTQILDENDAVLGAVSIRVELMSLLTRIDAPNFTASGGRIWFVGADGHAFGFCAQPDQRCAVEPDQLARLVGAIDWNETPSFRYTRSGSIISLYSLPGVKTAETGGLHVMISAPQRWIEEMMLAQVEETRALRSQTYLAYGVIGLLVLGVLVSLHTRRKLQSAYELADRASESKSAFLANTSHELRTPMTAILGYAELLGGRGDAEPSPEFRAEAVTAIQQNGKHLLTLIGDVLDLSKIEAGAIDIERLPSQPGAIADQTATLLRERAQDKGLRLDVRVAPDVPEWVQIDPTRTRQVLLNLVGNAIKFTESGSVTIHVELLRAAGAQRVAYTVQDTGIGMTPTAAATVFEAYVQAESSTTRRFGGTGLGLAISKQLTELMGGTIDCTSKVGEGTEFRFTVLAPNAQAPLEAEPAPALPRLSPDEHPSPLVPVDRQRPPRVLLADDGPTNRRLFSLILSKEGVDVTLASDGGEAVAAWEDAEVPFDLVLMDAQMPVLDGIEALNALRERGATLPVVVLTADAVSGAKERYLGAGFDGFLTKPITREALISAVNEWSGVSA